MSDLLDIAEQSTADHSASYAPPKPEPLVMQSIALPIRPQQPGESDEMFQWRVDRELAGDQTRKNRPRYHPPRA